MPRFTVQFGPIGREVEAANAEDAWVAFCAAEQTALRHPNMYQREIAEVVVVPVALDATPAVLEVTPQVESITEPTAPEPEAIAPGLADGPIESVTLSETLPPESGLRPPEPAAESVETTPLTEALPEPGPPEVSEHE